MQYESDEECNEVDDDKYLLTVRAQGRQYIESVNNTEYSKKIFAILDLKGIQVKFQLGC